MNSTLKTILWIIGIVLLCLALWYFLTLIAYILIAAVISFLGAPVVRLLRKLKIGNRPFPASLAAAVTLLLFVGVISAFFSLFAPLIAEEARVIAHIDFNQTALNIEGSLAQTEEWLGQFNLSGDEQTNQEYILEQIKGIIDFSQLSQVFNNVFSILGNAFIAVFSILFISFFFLKDSTMIARSIFTLTPDKHIEKIKNILENSGKLLTRYFVGVLAQIAITTLIVSIGLSIVGVSNAFIIGFLAGIFNLIPYVGPIIGAFLGLLISITSYFAMGDPDSSLTALVSGVLVVFLIAQLVDNFFTQPVILGNTVKAHPLEIFLIISIAATLGGITGMIVAIPVYTILRVVAKEFLSRFKVVESLTRQL